eukprot:364906-Chlamydomonas_euryale.AAC.12
MPRFAQVCADNATITASIYAADGVEKRLQANGFMTRLEPGGLTKHPQADGLKKRLETVFMAACSINGVYCADTSVGVHDTEVTAADVAAMMPGAPAVCAPVGSSRRATTYGTRFDASSTRRARATLRPGAPPVCLQLPCSAGGGGGGGGAAHRAPAPTLSFPQFLEALRLVAEDLVGHPAVRT